MGRERWFFQVQQTQASENLLQRATLRKRRISLFPFVGRSALLGRPARVTRVHKSPRINGWRRCLRMTSRCLLLFHHLDLRSHFFQSLPQTVHRTEIFDVPHHMRGRKKMKQKILTRRRPVCLHRHCFPSPAKQPARSDPQTTPAHFVAWKIPKRSPLKAKVEWQN